MRKNRVAATVTAIALAVSLLSGCGGSGGSTGNEGTGASGSRAAAEPRTDLNLHLATNPTIIIPCHAVSTYDMNLCYNVFDNLVEAVSDDSLEVAPSLAKDWEISEDGQEYTFYLQEGVKFHNGEDFTSEDVAYTFRMVMDSATTSGKTYMFDSYEIIDDYTVKLKLNQPYPWLLGLLASPAFGIVNKDAVEEFGDQEGAVVGTGAYCLDEWISGEKLVFKANEDYFKGAPSIKTITFKIILDNNSAFIAFQNGELDEYQNATSLDVGAVSSNPEIKVVPKTMTQVTSLVMNTKVKGLDDLKVRQAINYAIDRESMNIAVLDGAGVPIQLPFPKSHEGYTEEGGLRVQP